jgi:OOP family OmpA-OmpF porin
VGHAILPGLAFGTGSADLGEGQAASLEELAAFLKANPDARVALVGHTDATGSLEGNTALSRRRAQAAVDYLTGRHGINAARISAEGAGYLAPVASNLTAEGREQNRRVEAVLLP